MIFGTIRGTISIGHVADFIIKVKQNIVEKSYCNHNTIDDSSTSKLPPRELSDLFGNILFRPIYNESFRMS